MVAAQAALDTASAKAALMQAQNAIEQDIAAGRALAALYPDPLGHVQQAVGALPPGHTRESLLVLIATTKYEVAVISKGIVTGEHQLQALRVEIRYAVCFYCLPVRRYSGGTGLPRQPIDHLLACSSISVIFSNPLGSVIIVQIKIDVPFIDRFPSESL